MGMGDLLAYVKTRWKCRATHTLLDFVGTLCRVTRLRYVGTEGPSDCLIKRLICVVKS